MNEKELLHLEELARLSLNDLEREKLYAQTNEVIEYFNTLKELDTTDVEPLSHAFGLNNVLRRDELLPSLPAEKILQNAKTENGFFVAPISVEGEE